MATKPLKTLESRRAEDEKQVHEAFASRLQDLEACTNGSDVNASSGPVSIGSGDEMPFLDETQQVVLLNVAHRGQNPKSKIPGFRICGAFESVERLKQHVQYVQETGGAQSFGGATLLKADAHKKFLICSTFEKQQNSDYSMKKIADITAQYNSTLQFHNQEFKQNKDSHQQGKTGLSKREKTIKSTTRKKLMDEKFESDSKAGKEGGQISRAAEVRKQTVAVVSIMDDATPAVLNGQEDPEPIVIVWGCFEDEKIAKEYIRSTASKYVRDVMLDVVDMYTWVFPTEIAKHVDKIEEEFRNPALDKVMKARKTQKKTVETYDQWLKKENLQAAMLEITATKESEDSTEVHTEVKRSAETKVEVLVPALTDGKMPQADMKSATADAFESEDWMPLQKTKKELFQETIFKTNDPAPDTAAPTPVPTSAAGTGTGTASALIVSAPASAPASATASATASAPTSAPVVTVVPAPVVTVPRAPSHGDVNTAMFGFPTLPSKRVQIKKHIPGK